MTKRPLKRKKAKRPIEDVTELDRFFDECMTGMEEALTDFFEAFKDAEMRGYAYGFRMSSGPNGKPVIEEFGTEVLPADQDSEVWSAHTLAKTDIPENEPLTDVIEGGENVRVLAELPGVRMEDIKIEAKPKQISIKVDTAMWKYKKKIELPVEVLTEDIKTSLKNGILEIILRKDI